MKRQDARERGTMKSDRKSLEQMTFQSIFLNPRIFLRGEKSDFVKAESQTRALMTFRSACGNCLSLVSCF